MTRERKPHPPMSAKARAALDARNAVAKANGKGRKHKSVSISEDNRRWIEGRLRAEGGSFSGIIERAMIVYRAHCAQEGEA